MTTAEGRLDAHDAALAAQGRWLNGYEDELGEHDGAIKALQKIASEFAAFMTVLRTIGFWLRRAWIWVFRPLLVALGGALASLVALIVANFGTIIHAIDKLSAILSK